MKSKIIFFLLSIPNVFFAQMIGYESIDHSKVSKWTAEKENEYQYVYHFGDSEGESDLIIIYANNTFYAQIKEGGWAKDGMSWVSNYRNLTNVKVEGNQFYSDQTNGKFVIYDDGKKKIHGLKILKPWSGAGQNGEYEVGPKSYPIEDYYSGKFTQASKRKLTENEVKKLPKADLKIMRNEIFARYGYKFKVGGKMEAYFKQQKWYRGQHANVDDFLTELEKENIKLIQSVERNK